jgi:hypothetical protein
MDELMTADFRFYEVTSLVKRGRRFYYDDEKYIKDVRLDVYDDDGIWDVVEMLFSNERVLCKMIYDIVGYHVELNDLSIDYEGSDRYVITANFNIPIAILEAM